MRKKDSKLLLLPLLAVTLACEVHADCDNQWHTAEAESTGECLKSKNVVDPYFCFSKREGAFDRNFNRFEAFGYKGLKKGTHMHSRVGNSSVFYSSGFRSFFLVIT